MKKLFSMVAAMLLVSTGASAQEKASSLTLGFAPTGYTHVNINLDDEKYKYDYKSYMNVNLGFEKQFKGAVSLTEITYAQAKFDEYELTNPSTKWFNPFQTADIKDFAITTYVGKTIFPEKRVQLPLYIGIGGECIYGGPLHNLAIDLAAKARLKFYITGNFGFYVGATGRVGWGMKSASEKDSSNSDAYSVIPTMWALDAGLVIGL